MEHVWDIPLLCEAVLPAVAMRIDELLALTEGSVIKTVRPAGEAVEVFAGRALIGFAELAAANGRRAVRMVRFHGSR
jgi:flagellar motor switch/type III secretory pathway protein FliN